MGNTGKHRQRHRRTHQRHHQPQSMLVAVSLLLAASVQPSSSSSSSLSLGGVGAMAPTAGMAPPPDSPDTHIPDNTMSSTSRKSTRNTPHNTPRKLRNNRLPQHRIKRPQRHVPYPEDHPLARHLKQQQQRRQHEIGEADNNHQVMGVDDNAAIHTHNDGRVVGGDSSENRWRRLDRRKRRHNPDNRYDMQPSDHLFRGGATETTITPPSSTTPLTTTATITEEEQEKQPSYLQKFLQFFQRNDGINYHNLQHHDNNNVMFRTQIITTEEYQKHANNPVMTEGRVTMSKNDNKVDVNGNQKPQTNTVVKYWSVTGRSLLFNSQNSTIMNTENPTDIQNFTDAIKPFNRNSTNSITNHANNPNTIKNVNNANITNVTNITSEEEGYHHYSDNETITVNGTSLHDAALLEQELQQQQNQELGQDGSSGEDSSQSSLLFGEGHTMPATASTILEEEVAESSATEAVTTTTSNETPHSFSTSSSASTSASQSSSSSSLYQPIRLRAIFTDDDTSGSKYLTPNQRRILMEDMINPALYAWSKALHVVPVGSGIDNGSDDSGSPGSALIVDRSQLYDNETCGPGLDSGLPSVRVPLEHLTEGVLDTDTVIYVSVSFADSSHGGGSGAGGVDPQYSSSSSFHEDLHFLYGERSAPLLFEGGTTYRDGNGTVANETEEAGESITGNNQTASTTESPSNAPSNIPSNPPSEVEPMVESRPICPGNYLASATYCSTDQYDRPVAGILSICIDNIHAFFYDKDKIKRNIVTIMHEMGHILGFNAQSLSHFRDGDTGEPLTPRDENGDVPDTKVECTGISPRVTSEIPMPSTNITKFQVVRGGVRVATIVTPTVKRIARNMFGCQSLMGAELESGEGQLFDNDAEELYPLLSAGECIGDHWERRLFRTDTMNPIVDDVPYSLFISSLTLAYFADSGWYKIDSDRIAPSSIWGRNAGCEFVQKKCINSAGNVPASSNTFFCNNFLSPLETSSSEAKSTSTSSLPSKSRSSSPASESESENDLSLEIHGCDLDSTRKAVCSLVEHETELPHEYTYFSKVDAHGQLLGGKDSTLDYCPVFEGFSNGQCNDKDAKDVVGIDSQLEVFGEDNSRCVIGHVDRVRTALCLPIACVIQDQSLMIKVDGYWKRCMYAGQIVSMWWSPNNYVVCPDPSRLCPTFFCPNDCFKEGGVCDYHSGQCLCEIARNDTSANTTTSWFSAYYSSPLMEPCNDDLSFHTSNDTYQVVERMDSELPQFYIENITLLHDDPKKFDDKMSRMFAELNAGEVVGLVASFMLFVVFSCLFWSQLMRCYKERIVGSTLSKVRSSIKFLPGVLRDSGRLSNNHDSSDDDGHGMNSRPRRPPGHNPQKDKMVASLLVQMRTEGAAIEEQQQQDRLHLGGLTNNTSNSDEDKTETEKNTTASQMDSQTIVDLSSPSDEEVLVHRSDLPPLPDGGRVLAVVGARIIEDSTTLIENDDARSSATSATHITTHSASFSETSGLASPLYQDDGERQNNQRQSRLRFRHGGRGDRQDC